MQAVEDRSCCQHLELYRHHVTEFISPTYRVAQLYPQALDFHLLPSDKPYSLMVRLCFPGGDMGSYFWEFCQGYAIRGSFTCHTSQDWWFLTSPSNSINLSWNWTCHTCVQKRTCCSYTTEEDLKTNLTHYALSFLNNINRLNIKEAGMARAMMFGRAAPVYMLFLGIRGAAPLNIKVQAAPAKRFLGL